MSYISIGDMAQTFLLRQQNTHLKTSATRLALELSTGKTSNISQRFSGDFTVISGIENSLKSLHTYVTSAKEAANFSTAMQTALGFVQDQTTSAASSLMLTSNSASLTQIQNTAVDVRQKFDAVVSSLNTQIGGRSIFAGTATNKPAIASASDMIIDLQTAIAGQTTAAGIEAAVNTWFDTPSGGYETTGYLGSSTKLAPFKIGTDQNVSVSFTASDTTLRDTLKGLALAALVSEGALSGNISEQALLLKNAGTSLLSVGENQTGMRANIGTAQANIDTVIAHSAAEISALDITKAKLLSVDPYESASELEAVQTQLETLYALTARISRLSLVDFLR